MGGGRPGLRPTRGRCCELGEGCPQLSGSSGGGGELLHLFDGPERAVRRSGHPADGLLHQGSADVVGSAPQYGDGSALAELDPRALDVVGALSVIMAKTSPFPSPSSFTEIAAQRRCGGLLRAGRRMERWPPEQYWRPLLMCVRANGARGSG